MSTRSTVETPHVCGYCNGLHDLAMNRRPAGRTTTLDQAWEEAERQLPEGWGIRIMTCRCLGGDHGNWHISASHDLGSWADPSVYVEGPPVAALRALSASLQEWKERWEVAR